LKLELNSPQIFASVRWFVVDHEPEFQVIELFDCFLSYSPCSCYRRMMSDPCVLWFREFILLNKS
jgi:hypothetical protein